MFRCLDRELSRESITVLVYERFFIRTAIRSSRVRSPCARRPRRSMPRAADAPVPMHRTLRTDLVTYRCGSDDYWHVRYRERIEKEHGRRCVSLPDSRVGKPVKVSGIKVSNVDQTKRSAVVTSQHLLL